MRPHQRASASLNRTCEDPRCSPSNLRCQLTASCPHPLRAFGQFAACGAIDLSSPFRPLHGEYRTHSAANSFPFVRAAPTLNAQPSQPAPLVRCLLDCTIANPRDERRVREQRHPIGGTSHDPHRPPGRLSRIMLVANTVKPHVASAGMRPIPFVVRDELDQNVRIRRATCLYGI